MNKDMLIKEMADMLDKMLSEATEGWSFDKTKKEAKALIEQAREAEKDKSRSNNKRTMKLVEDQTKDEAIFFDAKTAPEAYLQDRLKELHKIITEEDHEDDRVPEIFPGTHKALDALTT